MTPDPAAFYYSLHTGLKDKFRGAARARHHLIGGDLALISGLVLVFDAVIIKRIRTISLRAT
jgi:hypothetical protein